MSYIGPKQVSYGGQNQLNQQPTSPYKSGISQQAEYSANNPSSGQTPQIFAEPTPSSPHQPVSEGYAPKESESKYRRSTIFSKTFDTNANELKLGEAKRGKRQADGHLVSPIESVYDGRTEMRPRETNERTIGYNRKFCSIKLHFVK